MTEPLTPVSYCPRCDKEFSADTKKEANVLVHEHLKIQIDDVHDGALVQWEEQLYDEQHYGG